MYIPSQIVSVNIKRINAIYVRHYYNLLILNKVDVSMECREGIEIYLTLQSISRFIKMYFSKVLALLVNSL